MRLTTAIAVFAFAVPALSMPSPEPLLPAPVSKRTINLWEKWTGDNCCPDSDKVQECKTVYDNDCTPECVCTPWKDCGQSCEYWCTKNHGTLDENCDCIYPSGYTDPHDPHKIRRRATLSCPMGHSACLVDPKASKYKTECLDLLTTLDSCGGCATEGQGVDCTLLANVQDVSCEMGACKVYSCDKGFKIENGTACVPDESAGSVKHLVISGLTGAEKFWSH